MLTIAKDLLQKKQTIQKKKKKGIKNGGLIRSNAYWVRKSIYSRVHQQFSCLHPLIKTK